MKAEGRMECLQLKKNVEETELDIIFMYFARVYMVEIFKVL